MRTVLVLTLALARIAATTRQPLPDLLHVSSMTERFSGPTNVSR